MEKRRKKRKTIHLNAESISGDSNFAVFIENLSEDGIYMITAPSNGQLEFTPNQAVTIKLKLSSGDTIDLSCKVIWAYKLPPSGITHSVGMEVIEPPKQYKEFVKTLQ
jgi:hypothetical protein